MSWRNITGFRTRQVFAHKAQHVSLLVVLHFQHLVCFQPRWHREIYLENQISFLLVTSVDTEAC